MRLAKVISRTAIGAGLLTLLAGAPPVYAQRAGQWGGGPGPRGAAPSQTPAAPGPVVVDRVNHGSIRHVEVPVVQRPVEIRHGIDVRHDVIVHRDVDVDFHHARFWDGFVFGARFRALPVGCVRVIVRGNPYFYSNGIYYQQAADSYQEVYPPVGAVVAQPPDGAIAVVAGNLVYYYAGGAFYTQQGAGYAIAPTPIGVIVPELPPGAVQVSVNGGIAYQFNGIYYRPVFVNGVTQYMTITF